MTSAEPGASALEGLCGAIEGLPLVSSALEKLAKDLERHAVLAKSAGARVDKLEEELLAGLRRLEEERRAWEEIRPRRGRREAVIREEIRRTVRTLLAQNPKVGWPAIQGATGLSEHLSRRVLREERGRKLGQVAGGKSSPPPTRA